MTRPDLTTAFLDRAGWGAARRSPLAGDASGRRYERLNRGAARAVLMDAPPDLGQSTGPFVRIARHLSGLGLSAPEILDEDRPDGLLLLEDLGDGVFARLFERDPSSEPELYAAAVDALVALHRHPAPADLPGFSNTQLADALDIVLPWYALRGPDPAHLRDLARLRALIRAALDSAPDVPPVMALRDFHAENLIWLPERSGVARVGLLDFQDAFAGHPAYDLVSLLEDARRDVPAPLRAAMIERYLDQTGLDPDGFRAACLAIGIQRNLRILGVFARLCRFGGKPHYATLLPRVWGYLQGSLADPALAELRDCIDALLPAPTPEHLSALAEAGAPVPGAVMLFAAGFGTRMKALTRDRPKPLIPVAGRPLLEHALDLTAAAGLPRRVVNTHYLGDQIADHLRARPDILISPEAPEILETGGGLLQARPLLGPGPVFTLNTDYAWTGANPFRQLAAAWDPERMDALLLLVRPGDARGHAGGGDFVIGADGRLSRGDGAIYAGAQLLCPDGLDAIPETAFSLNLLWDRMLDAGRLFGCLHDGQWCDVGRPECIALAEDMLRGGPDA